MLDTLTIFPTAKPPFPRASRAPVALVVDGDPLGARLEAAFRREGLAPRRVATWAEAAADADAGVALVLLDVAAPDLDGFALCRELCERQAAPVIVYTRLQREDAKVRALDLGAADYVVKPVGVEELLARIRAVLRRSPTLASPSPERIVVGTLTLFPAEQRLLRRGAEVRLTPTEFAILALLARNAGKTLTHSAILRRVWGPEYRDEHEYVWAYVRRLRLKLEEDPGRPKSLCSVAGVGYRLAS